MRKQTKIAAIVSAAALLAIGASMTSFAATGWQEENGTWVYYDRSGELVTGDWAKSGDKWFYLNDDGEMATDAIIEHNENVYYVDVNGVMVTNRWVEVENEDVDDENAPATVWYYFQNNGKGYKAPNSGKTAFKTINGKKYAFDADGKMLFGWVNEFAQRLTDDGAWEEATYFLGDSNDGAQVSSDWRHIAVVDAQADDEDQTYWFYFGANGKKYAKPLTQAGLFEKTINGRRYTFDVNGKMLSEWVWTASPASTDAANYKFFSSPEDGARKTKGWFRVMPNSKFDFDNSEEGDANDKWYYADGKGKLYTSAVKSINGKKYAFNEKGAMLSGLLAVSFTGNTATFDKIDTEDKVDRYTKVGTTMTFTGKDGIYLFGEEVSDGSMKTGINTVNIDGNSYSFNFRNSGASKGLAYNGKQNKAYYVNGRKVMADADNRFAAFEVTSDGKVVQKIEDSTTLVLPIANNNRRGELEYTGDKNAYVNTVKINPANKLVVLTTTGAIVGSGTKKDGNDVRLVVKNGFLAGAFIQE